MRIDLRGLLGTHPHLIIVLVRYCVAWLAVRWAAAIVAMYYFVTITVYLALLQGQWGYSSFDSSHVHDAFSHRRYLLAVLFPGLVCQWLLTRSFTIYYKRPFIPPPRQSSLLLTALRWTVKVRIIFSATVESREVAKVYLIRLYLAAFAIIAIVAIFIASASASFPLPYMYQPKRVDATTWDTRFQTLTYKFISLPLLLGAIHNLLIWGATKLTVSEVEALYALKRRKEARLLGIADIDHEDAAEGARRALAPGGRAACGGAGAADGFDPSDTHPGCRDVAAAAVASQAAAEETAVEEVALLRQLMSKKRMGELTRESLQEVEHLLRRSKAQTTLMCEKLDETRRRLDALTVERSEAISAVKSSKAFLSRGFRDIEMLLEAGFRELEEQRTSFMVNRRKKAPTTHRARPRTPRAAHRRHED